MKVFPAFVVQNPLPRFPVSAENEGETEPQMDDVEQGVERQEIRVGTGTMWLGGRVRSGGYRGGWWTRFKAWLRTIFC